MNWLESLLWDPSSVAHIVCLYAFVISVGVLLGKIKIFGVSLGVTFVLFAGILMGHLASRAKHTFCISSANSV
jgi:putative transport protein